MGSDGPDEAADGAGTHDRLHGTDWAGLGLAMGELELPDSVSRVAARTTGAMSVVCSGRP
jgi:hypothetical protein